MKTLLLTCFFFCIFVNALAQVNKPVTKVDIVFCIDLSGSTNGIVERLRNHFWDYVHELSTRNPHIDFRIGMVAYGRPSFGRENYYVKVIKDLTFDMEALSYELFQMRPQIEKGDQYVGAALQVCANSLSWSKDSSALKVIFLGGNGLVTTGVPDMCAKSAALLAQKNVIVNSIYFLNNPNVVEQRGWEEIASIGKGKYAVMNVRNEYFENGSKENMEGLFRVNRKLNNTYLYYGDIGKKRWLMQKENDEDMFKANPEGYRYRMEFRVSGLYLGKNAAWDMVDLCTNNPIALRQLSMDREKMPDTLKYLTASDLRAHVIFNKNARSKAIADIRLILAHGFGTAEKAPREEKAMQTFDVITLKWLRELLDPDPAN